MTTALIIEPLNVSHDRTTFTCGDPALDRYFREQASQDAKRRLGNSFVARDRTQGSIVGYYTLAASSIPIGDLPEGETKRLPHYSVLPATPIGRLAVDSRFQGRHIGSTLIIDALRRASMAAPASYAVLVNAKHDGAARFYSRCGFTPIVGDPLTLFLPVTLGLKLFASI